MIEDFATIIAFLWSLDPMIFASVIAIWLIQVTFMIAAVVIVLQFLGYAVLRTTRLFMGAIGVK